MRFGAISSRSQFRQSSAEAKKKNNHPKHDTPNFYSKCGFTDFAAKRQVEESGLQPAGGGLLLTETSRAHIESGEAEPVRQKNSGATTVDRLPASGFRTGFGRRNGYPLRGPTHPQGGPNELCAFPEPTDPLRMGPCSCPDALGHPSGLAGPTRKQWARSGTHSVHVDAWGKKVRLVMHVKKYKYKQILLIYYINILIIIIIINN